MEQEKKIETWKKKDIEGVQPNMEIEVQSVIKKKHIGHVPVYMRCTE